MSRRRGRILAALSFTGKAALVISILGLLGLGYWLGNLFGVF